jgi:hypothetical protein
MQSLFIDKIGMKALLDFAKHTGLGYCKMVRCRSTLLEEEDEKKDEW